jgi:4'-phosphopantetheinyl transferase
LRKGIGAGIFDSVSLGLPSPTIRFVRTAEIDLGRLSGWGLELLSPDEHAAFDRLRHPSSRRDYLAAHLVLRLSVARALAVAPADVRLVYEESGRPRIDGAVVQISLTHCYGLGACAVSAVGDTAPIGIDAEQLSAGSRVWEVRDLGLNAAEQSWAGFLEEERNARLVALWTAKEAVLKAIGIGVRDLLRVECRPGPWHGGCAGSFLTASGQVTTCHLPGDYCLAWSRLGADGLDHAVPEELVFPLGEP